MTEEDYREMKVKVPVSLHQRLWKLKLATGKTISDMVINSMREYCEETEERLKNEQR